MSTPTGNTNTEVYAPGRVTHYKVLAHVIEARGLISSGSEHVSHALCVLEMGPNCKFRRTTDTQPNTNNAVWDQVFMFEHVPLRDEEFAQEKLSFSVLNKNDFTRNRLIGSYEFSLGNIYRQKNHQYYRQWVPLTLPEKPENDEGYLLVTVYVLGPNDPTPLGTDKDRDNDSNVLNSPALPERRTYVLNVIIYRGVDILSTQESSKSSVKPFLSARFNGNILQTQHMPVENAVWNARLEMPFSQPLRSDSIELTLWNHKLLQSDQIISSKTFNFFQLGLSHKAWGPRWVNFYARDYTAPQVSLLGKVLNSITQETTHHKHEYVGRVLMRLSVDQKDEALLLRMSAAPVLDPIGQDYALQVLLYSASELPVLGGKVRVEVVFGSHRVKSSWQFAKAGENGTFLWHEKLPPVAHYCPADRSQVHAIILNVYHRVGGKVTKIAYEKIKATSLMPLGSGPNLFFINGETQVGKHSKANAWPARWRSLAHVHPSEEKSHVSAGFLMASIGFGRKADMPVDIPSPVSMNYHRFTLRCYLHQGANLLAADGHGSCNPMLTIRFSGKSERIECEKKDEEGNVRKEFSQKNTLFPMWFEVREIDVYIDPDRAPSIYMNVYHTSAFSHIPIGRCEILASHVLANPNQLCRYRLKYDQDNMSIVKSGSLLDMPPKGSELADKILPEDLEPYILASFELFPSNERDKWPLAKNYPPPTKDFLLKVEAIGLREMGTLGDGANNPELEVSVPILHFRNRNNNTNNTNNPGEEDAGNATTAGGGGGGKDGNTDGEALLPSGKNASSSDSKEMETDSSGTATSTASQKAYVAPDIKVQRQYLPVSAISNGAGQILKAHMFARVPLPVTDPYAVPLTLRLFNGPNASREGNEDIICTRFIPIAELLDNPLEYPRPPTYKYEQPGRRAGKAGPSGNNGITGSLATGWSRVGSATGGNDLTISGLDHDAKYTDIPREFENVEIQLEDDGEDWGEEGGDGEDDGGRAKRRGGVTEEGVDDPMAVEDDPFSLELDPVKMNVSSGLLSKPGVPTKLVWKNEALDAPIVLDDDDEADDGFHDEALQNKEPSHKPRLRIFAMFKGKGRGVAGALRAALFDVTGPQNQVKVCVLKAYVQCKPLAPTPREIEKQMEAIRREDMIGPVRGMYNKKYICRVYVYTGINLTPTSESLLDSYQSSSPYLIAMNGTEEMNKQSFRARAKEDDLNPDFYQLVELPTRIPENTKLEIQVWNAVTVGLDDHIGTALIDLETRLLQQQLDPLNFVPTTEYHDLHNESSTVSQGKVALKLEILTEEEARRIKPEDVTPPTSAEYELRLVIWSTRDVRHPDESTADDSIDNVNQRIVVTTNFEGKKGQEVVKQTDVSWDSAGGRADWNYRMKWRIKNPCKLPRIKFAMWNETVVSSNELIGEALFNLTPFLQACQKDKKPISKTEQEWISFSHPNFRELNLGQVLVEYWLLTDTEADKAPVGEAQNEPNRDPFLREPKRNLPPWAIGSKGLGWLQARRKLIMMIIICCVVIPAVVPIIIFAATGI